LSNCRDYLAREWSLLPQASVIVALGALAFEACLKMLLETGETLPRPRPRFAHGVSYQLGRHSLIATYHPSQQNTFTGKLTQPMLRSVLRRAKKAAGL
jgi:uracil-DNA glycosylase